MNDLEYKLDTSKKSAYTALRSYILMRPYTYTKNNQKLEVKLSDDLIEKYFLAYEAIAGKYLNQDVSYKNYKQIIKKHTDEVTFTSLRKDSLAIQLNCYANCLDLNICMLKKDNNIIYNVMTAFANYDLKTYVQFIKEKSKDIILVKKEAKRALEIIGEKVDKYSEALWENNCMKNYIEY